MVEKRAKARQRAQRKDPGQETILQMKDEVNARTSRLIELLKQIKSGLNGGPAPDIGIEKFKLTDPMPAEVAQTGRSAIQELNSILEGIQRADQMQDEYAQQRADKMNERMQRMQEVQQAAEFDIRIRKEASNKLTRLWANIVAPFGSEQGKSERLMMLNALGRIDSNLKEVEDKVLSKDPSILSAVHEVRNLYSDANATFFNTFRENLNQMITSSVAVADDLQRSIAEEDKKNRSVEKDKEGKNVQPADKSKVQFDVPWLDKKKEHKEEKTEDSARQEAKPEVSEPAKENKPESPEEFIEVEDKPQPESKPKKNLKKNVSIPGELPSFLTEEEAKGVVPVPESSIETDIVEEYKAEPEPIEINLEETEVQKERTPEEKSIIYRKHLLNNVQTLYSDVYNEISDTGSLPNPWNERVRDQWSALNAQAETASQMIIRASPEGVDMKKFVEKQHIQYLMFIKLVGDIKTSLNAYKHEKEMAKSDENFQWGSTLNEQALQNNALQFTQGYREELKTLASISHSLVALGSNKFTRMLKRWRTQMSWGQADRSLRLLVDKNVREARKNLQGMMNNLEKRNINFRTLITDSIRFYDSLIDVYDGIFSLANMYNSRMLMEKSQRKKEREYMPYDIIRESDIRNMKYISKELQNDRERIKKLYSLEDKIPELESILEKLRNENG